MSPSTLFVPNSLQSISPHNRRLIGLFATSRLTGLSHLHTAARHRPHCPSSRIRQLLSPPSSSLTWLPSLLSQQQLLLPQQSQQQHLPVQSRRVFSSSKMAPIPATMKAIQISKTGGTEVLDHNDVPVPTPGPGQLLVKNHFAGINFIDTYFRTGLYPTAKFPLTLGREASGEVVSTGNSSFPPGTRVVYMAGDTYAEYTAVDADILIAIPDNLSYEDATTVYLQGLTAWTFVREAGNVQAGQWTLVHAAAGGVGVLLVQMLKTVGAKIIATASTDEKLALAKKYGADYLVNSNDDIAKKVKEITGGHGVDVIFDGVGKVTFDADLEMIALKGHLISFGNASGAVDPVNILRLGPKNVKLMRPILNGYVATREDLEKYAKELFDLVSSKKVEVNIHEIYPLKDARQAHSDLESRKTTGKLLLKF